MQKYNLEERILGCLYTAGIGDAMGAPSEAYSQQEIKATFHGWITEFHGPGDNMYVQGNVAGEVTDDTTQLYEMARAIIKSKGDFKIEDAAEALVYWAQKYPKYYPRNAGMTTRYVIEELKKGADPATTGLLGGIYGRGTSNGAAMRVAAAGLIHPGDLDGAVHTAVVMSKPSHATQHAYAGACAIACGIAEALREEAQVYTILEACLYGMKKGEEIGLCEARAAAGEATLVKTMRGIQVALSNEHMDDFLAQLEAQVGNDGSIQTSVAAAIAIFAATKGDVKKTVLYGANLGGDTDTIGCIAGMLAGAYKGNKEIPQDWLTIFKEANKELDFDTIGKELYLIAVK